MKHFHDHQTFTPRPIRLTLLLVLSLVGGSCAYTVDLTPTRNLARTSVVLAADGSIITELHAEEDREPVPLSEVADSLIDAVVAVEDQRFFEHSGVDLVGTARALVVNAGAGDIRQGGSTITQQYVKNALLDSERTLERKIKEASLAYQLEKRHSKEEILERYLNTVYFGLGAYGAQAASERFFGKDAGELTLAESALLAGMIRAPERYDPLQLPEEAEARRSRVLDQMLALGMIDREERDAANSEPLSVGEPDERYPAGHFVEAVKRFILDNEAFGETREDRRNLLFGGGLTIHTTLDPRWQQFAEEAVSGVLDEHADGPDQPIAAVIALEPETGAVRAHWGGYEFFGDAEKAKFDFATVGRRQAGSAFKPFALVAALEAGISPRHLIPAPAQIEIDMGENQDPWEVRNYGRGGYGTLTLAQGTTLSVNTVYAQLIMELGADRVTETAARMGIDSPLVPVPSAVLGTNAVSPLDMASAYGTLALDGRHVEPTFVLKVEDHEGEVLWQRRAEAVPVLDPMVARTATEILSTVVDRGTARAADPGRPAAGKTGTNQLWRDAWFVGYTPDVVVAVWVGFPDRPRPMVPPATPRRITGGSWPAMIWRAFVTSALDGMEPREFPDAPPFEATHRLELAETGRCPSTSYDDDLPVLGADDEDDDTRCVTTTQATTTTASTTTTTRPPSTTSSTTTSSTITSSTTTSSTTTTTLPPSTTSSTTTSSSSTTSSTTTSSTTTSSTTTSSTTTTSAPGG